MARQFINVTLHRSQHPDSVAAELRRSFRNRRLNPKSLYESPKQTRQWLAVHRTYSAWRIDPDCARVYHEAFLAAARHLEAVPGVGVIGLGCGSGEKDASLLRTFAQSRERLLYFPVDVSPSLVLLASEAALDAKPEIECHPLVCDLNECEDFSDWLETRTSEGARRCFTFLGMIPNWEPRSVSARLNGWLKTNDLLLLSANLTPGDDYEAGVRKILDQYDNPPTRDWLFAFLTDVGFERDDGTLEFVVEPSETETGLLRISAYFRLARSRRIEISGGPLEFSTGEAIRVFFSYRSTPDRLRRLLSDSRLVELGEWITPSGEEGVFLFQRADSNEMGSKRTPRVLEDVS